MKKKTSDLIQKALKALAVETGFVEGHENKPDAYFAENQALNLRVYAFSEAEALELFHIEAEALLLKKLSLVKEILKA